MILRKIEELKGEVLINRKLLQELMQKSKAGRKDLAPSLPDGVVLPLQNFQQVEKVERVIRRGSAEQQQLVNIYRST